MLRAKFSVLFSIAALAAIATSARAQTTSPPAKSAPVKPAAGSATLVVYVECPIMTLLTGYKGEPQAEIVVDRKTVGVLTFCSHKSFRVPAGKRVFMVKRAGWPVLDPSVFGLEGPFQVFPAGRTTYVAAYHTQYFQWREVPAAQAIAAIKAMPK